jgi:WXXGXW repeat (2 copies)
MKMTTKSLRFLDIAVVMLALSAASFAQIGVGVSVSFGPPALPVYAQPICPAPGYIWTPGYWAYDPDFGDYYWVPGTWVLAPEVGFLWTPGWWGWGGSGFIFHAGYWGPVVGFYGGINYGYGYFGHGYEGGRWDRGQFYYNRTVNNVNVTNIHNVYNSTVINNNSNHVSYNGGTGGITARPTAQEEAAARERHVPPVAAQTQHAQAARSDTQLRASVNQGKPPIAATSKPAELHGNGVVPAKQAGGRYTPPPNRAVAETKPGNNPAARPENNPQTARQQNNVPKPPEKNTPAARPENNQTARQQNNVPRPPTAVHPNDLPAVPRPPAPNTGNAELNQKYQQQQEQLRAQQQQDRQKLQQQQNQEHQQLAQQKANQERQQQLEQQHQQQTQRMYQQHVQQQQQQLAHQQQQQMQAHQQPHPNEPKPKQ